MATITIRTDDPTKAKLYDIADELGMSVSSIFNAYAKEIIRKKKVSFSIDDDYLEDQEMYSNAATLKARWEQSIASWRSSFTI